MNFIHFRNGLVIAIGLALSNSYAMDEETSQIIKLKAGSAIVPVDHQFVSKCLTLKNVIYDCPNPDSHIPVKITAPVLRHVVNLSQGNFSLPPDFNTAVRVIEAADYLGFGMPNDPKSRENLKKYAKVIYDILHSDESMVKFNRGDLSAYSGLSEVAKNLIFSAGSFKWDSFNHYDGSSLPGLEYVDIPASCNKIGLAFSNCGFRIINSSTNKLEWGFSNAKFQSKQKLEFESGRLFFSQDGTWVAMGGLCSERYGFGRGIFVAKYTAEEEEQQYLSRCLEDASGNISGIEFISPDNQFAVTKQIDCRDAEVAFAIYDLINKKKVSEYLCIISDPELTKFEGFSSIPSDKRFLVSIDNRKKVIFDYHNHKEYKFKYGNNFKDMKFFTDFSKYIQCKDRITYINTLAKDSITSNLVAQITHDSNVLSITISQDNSIALIRKENKTIDILDLRDNKIIKTFDCPNYSNITISPDKTKALLSHKLQDNKYQIYIVNLETGCIEKEIQREAVSSVYFSPSNNNEIFIASGKVVERLVRYSSLEHSLLKALLERCAKNAERPNPPKDWTDALLALGQTNQ